EIERRVVADAACCGVSKQPTARHRFRADFEKEEQQEQRNRAIYTSLRRRAVRGRWQRRTWRKEEQQPNRRNQRGEERERPPQRILIRHVWSRGKRFSQQRRKQPAKSEGKMDQA